MAMVARSPGASGTSSSTGNAVHLRESLPAVPPVTSMTTIACAPQPFTPLDQRRSQMVESGSASRLVNETRDVPRQS